jgi:NADH:ubiquinone oxidoreductase subunit K
LKSTQGALEMKQLSAQLKNELNISVTAGGSYVYLGLLQCIYNTHVYIKIDQVLLYETHTHI